MRFEPRPDFEFSEFYDTYFERCADVCPKLAAIAAKWKYEDLIPGLSDFDTRLIFHDGVSSEDWKQISVAVGRVHERLVRERPEWARIMEHLPGPVLTVSEMTDPVFYYSEFHQWTFYRGDSDVITKIKKHLSGRSWDERDELFFLKKFSTYFGPYIHGIDPPVNLGAWENKYPLHSRFMHYFTPPLQSALSIIHKRALAGKFESLRLARNLIDDSRVIDMILDCVDRHYEVPAFFKEDRLREIETALLGYLEAVYEALSEYTSVARLSGTESNAELKNILSAIPVEAAARFYDGVKFIRLIKGRLNFYAKDIEWFDSAWLIRNEFQRMGNNFYRSPFTVYGEHRFGEQLDPDVVVKRLVGSLIDEDEYEAVRRFIEIVDQPIDRGGERERASRVAELIDPIQDVLERVRGEIGGKVTE